MTPNGGMLTLEAISCQRGHNYHPSHSVVVDGVGREPFVMFAWDQLEHDGGPLCPARDIVSQTITENGLWEPHEAALVVPIFRAASGATVIDMGSHVGWYSMLAASYGLNVLAIDAHPEAVQLLRASAAFNGYGIDVREQRIDETSKPLAVGDAPIALLKIDVEGAEGEALDMLRVPIETGQVQAILLEVSPVFRHGYPDIVARLVRLGYTAQEVIYGTRLDLMPEAEMRGAVARCNQMNVMFTMEAS